MKRVCPTIWNRIRPNIVCGVGLDQSSKLLSKSAQMRRFMHRIIALPFHLQRNERTLSLARDDKSQRPLGPAHCHV